MCDFDLSQSLDSSSETCCCGTMDGRGDIIRLDDGLDLVVSCNPTTMQRVASLLLAANRMKKLLNHQHLSDEQLGSVILDSLVDVKMVQDFAAGRTKIFQRCHSVRQCSLCDRHQKDLVCAPDLKLQAITLKGGNRERKVLFKLSRYVTAPVSAGDGQVVVLSITSSLHISCSMKDDQAVLNVEECIEENLKRISDDGNMDRFLFYKRAMGKSLITFESVRWRGWFISTSSEQENQPVEMCRMDTAKRLTAFKID